MVSRAVFFFAFGCELESFPLGLSSRANNATSERTHKSHNDSFEKALSDNLLFLIFCIWPFYLFALRSLLLPLLRGLAYAVSNGHLTDEECYEALPNKLNYEESMFFKDCTMDAIKEIASAELEKLATVSGVAVKDLVSPEATAIRK
jgi:hypothetical protein